MTETVLVTRLDRGAARCLAGSRSGTGPAGLRTRGAGVAHGSTGRPGEGEAALHSGPAHLHGVRSLCQVHVTLGAERRATDNATATHVSSAFSPCPACPCGPSC